MTLDPNALDVAWSDAEGICGWSGAIPEWFESSIKTYLDALPSGQAPLEGVVDEPIEEISLRVALSFADHPRPYHTLQAPADTNSELYGALKTLAAAYRSALLPASAEPVVLEAMVEAAVETAREHLEIDGDNEGPFIRFDSIDRAVRAVLTIALAPPPPIQCSR